MKPTVSRGAGAPPSSPTRRGAGGPSSSGGGARQTDARAFVQGVIAEMRRVTWPSREEWVAATILTVALVVGVGVFTYLVDLLLGEIFKFMQTGAF